MELLAPAGSMKNFMAAIEAGADAIFLGGKLFNARAQAGNFSIEELQEAVKLAHLMNVAVHVTVNIVVGDDEMAELRRYIKELERIGVDALIVQDLGVARIVREEAPNLPLHGSTQMSVTNLATVEELGKLGFTRVVLGREVGLVEIRHICANTDVEIEVFIHGALCICYSGQCFMSSLIGGRSGNRGACAQPCRKPYELLDDTGKALLPAHEAYLLSPKDLNHSEYMAELMEAGVASFKIEGRMKKPSYVTSVVGTYRNIIDNYGRVSKADSRRLQEGFNRGFSHAYLTDTVGKEMMTVVAPNNQGKLIGRGTGKGSWLEITADEPLVNGDLLKLFTSHNEVIYFTVQDNWTMRRHKQTYVYGVPARADYEAKVYRAASANEDESSYTLDSFTKKIPVYAYLHGAEGETAELTCVLADGESVTVSNDYVVQRAQKTPTSLEKITAQLNRLRNTVFALQEVHAPDGEFMWPASVLNQLRRDAVHSLEDVLLRRYGEKTVKRPHECARPLPAVLTYPAEPFISVRADEVEQVKAAVEAGATKIVFGGERFSRRPYENAVYQDVADLCHSHDVFLTFALPRIVKDDEVEAFMSTLHAMTAAAPDSMSIHFLGAFSWLRQCGYQGAVDMDTGFNVFNREAVAFCQDMGASSVTLSPELTLAQIRKMRKGTTVPFEAMVHGRAEMMISEYCVIGSFVGTGIKANCPAPCLQGNYYLKDSKGEVFPLKTDPYCRMHILNGKELDMSPYVDKLCRAGVTALRIEGRGRDESYIRTTVGLYRDIVNGTRKVTEKVQTHVTRGHYFKGIF